MILGPQERRFPGLKKSLKYPLAGRVRDVIYYPTVARERAASILDNGQMEDKENYNVTRLVRFSC